jgi:hypothetical protein
LVPRKITSPILSSLFSPPLDPQKVTLILVTEMETSLVSAANRFDPVSVNWPTSGRLAAMKTVRTAVRQKNAGALEGKPPGLEQFSTAFGQSMLSAHAVQAVSIPHQRPHHEDTPCCELSHLDATQNAQPSSTLWDLTAS